MYPMIQEIFNPSQRHGKPLTFGIVLRLLITVAVSFRSFLLKVCRVTEVQSLPPIFTSHLVGHGWSHELRQTSRSIVFLPSF